MSEREREREKRERKIEKERAQEQQTDQTKDKKVNSTRQKTSKKMSEEATIENRKTNAHLEQEQALVDAAPVLALAVLEHALPQHAHGLGKLLVAVRGLGNLAHHRAVRAPGLVRVGGLAHLDLDG